jgi:hypothetical protein
MPLPEHFTEHALRQALNDEFHARPPVPLQSPQLISYVAMHHEGEAPAPRCSTSSCSAGSSASRSTPRAATA